MIEDTWNDSEADTYISTSDLMTNVVMALLLVVFLLMTIMKVGESAAEVLKQQRDDAIERRLNSVNVAAAKIEEMENKSETLESRLRKSQKQEEVQRQENQALQSMVQDLEEQVTQLSAGQSVSLAIAVDCTGSMENAIGDLKRAIEALAETMPEALSSFHIGLVLYRDGKTVQYPLTQIRRKQDDGGASLQSLLAFTNRIAANQGLANVDQAISEAMQMLDTSASADSRQLLFLLGDVSTGELPTHTPYSDQQILQRATSWSASSGRDRRVLALYVGDADTKHQRFFEDLGSVNEQSVFATESAEMFISVFRAAFTEKQ